MTVIPLGTAAAIPTRSRHLSSIALVQSGRILLLDCGEGVQRRLKDAGLKHSRVELVCISHLHGDHFFGLFGLLSTMALCGRTAPLTIIAPAELAPILDDMPGVGAAERMFNMVYLPLRRELLPGMVFENSQWTIEARVLQHRTFTVGYRIQEHAREGSLDVDKARAMGVHEPGQFRALKRGESVVIDSGTVVESRQVVGPPPVPRSFVYLTDTRPCEEGQLLAADASLMLHDATFADEHKERAKATGHSTAREAAVIARRAGAGKLLLSHFSARYADLEHLVCQAREEFPDSLAAVELERYAIGE